MFAFLGNWIRTTKKTQPICKRGQNRKPFSARLHVEQLEERINPVLGAHRSLVDPGAQSSFDGDVISLQIAVIDNLGDPNTVDVIGLPTGLGYNASSCRIEGTFSSDASQNGPFSVIVSTNDGQSETINWAVAAPTITFTNPGTQNSFDGGSVSLQLVATEDAAHSLTFALDEDTPLPDGLTLTSDGLISGTIGANADQDGPYTITVIVTDSSANVSTSQTFTWNVTVYEAIWTGSSTGGDNVSWNDADNWQDRVVPGINGNYLVRVVIVDPNTTVTIDASDLVTIKSIACSAELEVQGALTLTAGNSVVTGRLDLSGSVSVNAGTLTLQGGGSYSGSFNIALDSEVVLDYGTFTAFQGGQNLGAGRFVIGNGGVPVVDVPAGATTFQKNVILNPGGTISGAGVFQLTGDCEWRGGTMSGAGTTENLGNLGILGNLVHLNGRTLRNLNSMSWKSEFAGANTTVVWRVNARGGGLGVQNIDNQGIWNIITLAGTTLRMNDVAPANPGLISNAGTINIYGSGRVELFHADTISNTSDILVHQGSLTISNLTDGFDNSAQGRITAAAGATVTFLHGDYFFAGFSTDVEDQHMKGDGTFMLGNGGKLTVSKTNQNENKIRVSNFEMLPGSELRGAGQFGAKRFTWTGGIMRGAVGAGANQPQSGTTFVDNGAEFFINGTVSMNRRVLMIDAGGVAIWNPGAETITLANDAAITVAGTFDVFEMNGEIEAPAGDTSAPNITVVNNGVLRKQDLLGGQSVTVGTRIKVPVINNGGQVTIQERTTFLGYTQEAGSGLTLGSGPYAFSQIQCNGGTVTLNGGQLTVDTPLNTTTQFQTSFALSGTVRGWLNNTFSNCTIDLQGDLAILDGNNDVQLRMRFSQLHLHAFSLNVSQGQITSNFSQIHLEGGSLNCRGAAPGSIRGPGSVNGNAIIGNGAHLDGSPGQVGTIAIAGNLTLEPGASAGFQISANASDQVVVQGHVSLAGELTASLIDYVPTMEDVGDLYVIMSCGSYEGTFENDTVELDDGFYLQVDYSDPYSIKLILQHHD